MRARIDNGPDPLTAEELELRLAFADFAVRNDDYGMAATVSERRDGRFSVNLIDTDARMVIGHAKIYPVGRREDAVIYAKGLVE